MKLRNFVIFQGLLFSLTLCVAGQTAPAATYTSEELAKGTVVEKVNQQSKAEKAGLQEGDVLLNWTAVDAHGEIESPFDLRQIEIEQAPRGAVRIEGLRGTQKQAWTLESDIRVITVRPNLPASLLSLYREGQELAKAGKPVEAVERWRAAAVEAQKFHSSWLGSWLLLHAAGLLANARQFAEADDFYREAVEEAKGMGPASKAQLFHEWARTYELRSDWPNAEKYSQQALIERQKLGAETMSVALNLGYIGLLAMKQDNLGDAEKYYRQSLAILEKLVPDSVYIASCMGNLGIVYHERGDLAQAEVHYRKALAIEEKLFPNSPNISKGLSDLGLIALARGDLTKAEQYQRQALAITHKLAPDTLAVASILEKLAEIAQNRGDPTTAEKYYQQSLMITKKVAPDGLLTATALQGLGELFPYHGAVQAQENYRQALAILERVAPGSLYVASDLKELGDVVQSQGNLSKAEEYYRQAMAIWEKLAPGSRYRAEALAAMAGLMRQKQQPDIAAQLYQQALNVLESQAGHLGGVEEDRSRFRSRYSDYYTNYAELLIAEKQPELAFEVLERLRARTLLEMLAVGHVDIRQGVDSALIEREHSLRDSIIAESNRRVRLLNEQHTEEQIAALDVRNQRLLAQFDDVQAQIRMISPSYAALTQPEPLSTKEVQRELLDADTLLLEYSLGEKRSYVFVVSAVSLTVYPLPKRATIERAAQRVYDLVTVENRQSSGDASSLQRQYSQAAARLSRMVLGPLTGHLRKRLLIVSDGRLHYVPFAALPVPGNPSVPLIARHEIVTLPSASVLSVLRREKMGRKLAPRTVAVLADPVFDTHDVRVKSVAAGKVPGNSNAAVQRGTEGEVQRGIEEDTQEAMAADSLTRSVADVGLAVKGTVYLPRLQRTRQEAMSILAVTPAGQGMQALDFKASRATVMSPALGQYRIVHFATHGLLDSKHPELSGLVLSLVDEQGRPQNGFLGLQDIYNLNLPAELVVLSACETGLGKSIQGEGLVGLTRGFMYAGATRVVASLWKIDDLATAELMAEFYKAMERDGMRPAAALRAAQIHMWKQQRWSSPYYWAAFQIHGEWK